MADVWSRWAWVIVLSVLCILLQATGMNTVIRFDRQAIDGGAWWLLYSGNLVHFDWMHLLRNLAGVALIQGLFGPLLQGWRWWLVLSICSLGVGLGLYFFMPQLGWYVGLSGAVFGAFVVGAMLELQQGWKFGLLLFVLVFGRLLYELTIGAMPGAESSGMTVVVESHLYGSLTGLLLGALLLWLRIKNRSASDGRFY
ncbi:MAG: rhombosortase [Gammaproteobacteria bacterium]|nr:rhombosortase [Gammaproteobacteria bacterium]